MKQFINIRPENHHDIDDIENVAISAFTNQAYSNQTEHKIIARLRADDALSVSLVAQVNNKIVGHVAFSKVKINNEFVHWYGLAPVSVKAGYQRLGIGSRLIFSGLDAIRKLNAHGCVVLGEPDFYSKLGFKAYDGLTLAGVPPEYFQSLSFTGDMVIGRVEYHSAFNENE
ncbi:MAG: GNAT family N-acetyltransferase [Cognaticolwellia sp.]